jgi:hypothetical protein
MARMVKPYVFFETLYLNCYLLLHGTVGYCSDIHYIDFVLRFHIWLEVSCQGSQGSDKGLCIPDVRILSDSPDMRTDIRLCSMIPFWALLHSHVKCYQLLRCCLLHSPYSQFPYVLSLCSNNLSSVCMYMHIAYECHWAHARSLGSPIDISIPDF